MQSHDIDKIQIIASAFSKYLHSGRVKLGEFVASPIQKSLADFRIFPEELFKAAIPGLILLESSNQNDRDAENACTPTVSPVGLINGYTVFNSAGHGLGLNGRVDAAEAPLPSAGRSQS